jgi:CheY-like chemotaxis protein
LLKIIKTNAQMSEKKFPNIVIAEDVESNYLYLKAVLTKLDAHVFWARNGIEVLEICEREKNIDLVLMDLQMPDMNGYEATAVLKQTYPNLPVIAQTAFAMSDDRDKAINAGCDDYLAKPIKSNDLLLMTMKYLNR